MFLVAVVGDFEHVVGSELIPSASDAVTEAAVVPREQGCEIGSASQRGHVPALRTASLRLGGVSAVSLGGVLLRLDGDPRGGAKSAPVSGAASLAAAEPLAIVADQRNESGTECVCHRGAGPLCRPVSCCRQPKIAMPEFEMSSIEPDRDFMRRTAR